MAYAFRFRKGYLATLKLIKMEKFIKQKKSQYGSRSKQKAEYDKTRYEKNKDKIREKFKKRWNDITINNPMKALLYCLRGNSRNKKTQCTITINDLWDIYNKQNGRCYYTNLRMELKWRSGSLYQISPDRLNPCMGYEKDNVVLCCKAINFAKSYSTEKEIKKFINDIADQFRQPVVVKSVCCKAELIEGKTNVYYTCVGCGKTYRQQTVL